MLDGSFQEGTRAHRITWFLIENHQVFWKRPPSIRIFNSTSLSPAKPSFFLHRYTSGEIRLSKFKLSRYFASLHYLWSMEIFNRCSVKFIEVQSRNFDFMWGKFVSLSPPTRFQPQGRPSARFPRQFGKESKPWCRLIQIWELHNGQELNKILSDCKTCDSRDEKHSASRDAWRSVWRAAPRSGHQTPTPKISSRPVPTSSFSIAVSNRG